MKKTKILTVIVSTLLAVSTLASCSFGVGKNEPETTQETPKTTADESVSSEITDEITSEKSTTEASTSKTDIPHIEDVEVMFKAICRFPQGTAGSSHKCAVLAKQLVHFTENNKLSEGKLSRKIDELKNNLSEDELNQYEENLYEIDAMARMFIKGEKNADLDGVDYTPISDSGEFSMEKYEAVFNLLKV